MPESITPGPPGQDAARARVVQLLDRPTMAVVLALAVGAAISVMASRQKR